MLKELTYHIKRDGEHPGIEFVDFVFYN